MTARSWKPHAVYLLEPIGADGELEAVHVAHWACSRRCAEVIAGTMAEPHSIGENTDAVEGTICEQCAEVLA
jgi:hypothetical protein